MYDCVFWNMNVFSTIQLFLQLWIFNLENVVVFCTSRPPYSWDQSAHMHASGVSAVGESFAAGEQAVRQEMKCLIREGMGTRRAWAGPGLLLTCPSRGEARKQGRDGRKGWGSRVGGGGRWGRKRRPSWGLKRVGMRGLGGTSGTGLVPSKERGESIDLCDPSDVEDVNTKRD